MIRSHRALTVFLFFPLYFLIPFPVPAQTGWGPSVMEARWARMRMASDAVGAYPTDAGARVRLGEAAYAAGFLDEAEDAFKAALGLDPGSAGALRGLGFICQANNDLQGAETFLKKALEAKPEDQRASYHLLRVYREMKNAAGMADMNRRLSALDNDPAGRIENPFLERRLAKSHPKIVWQAPSCRIPMDIIGDVPHIGITLGGEKINAAVDTAATNLIIDLSWALRHELELYPGAPSSNNPSGRPLPQYNCLLDELDIGCVRLRDVWAVVMDLKPAFASDAVVGWTILREFRFALDYKGKWLEACGFSVCPPKDGGDRFYFRTGSMPFALGTVNTCQAVPLTLDTGSPYPMAVSSSLLAVCGVRLKGTPAEYFGSMGHVGVALPVGIENLFFGSLEAKDVGGIFGVISPVLENDEIWLGGLVSPCLFPDKSRLTMDASLMRFWVE